MKQKVYKTVFMAFFFFACMNVLAQQTSMTIDNQSPGWLSSKIGYEDQQTIENLKVIGYINGDDLQFIARLMNENSLHGRLDLLDANIVSTTGGENNYLYNDTKIWGVSSSSTKPSLYLQYLSLPRTLVFGAGNSMGKLEIDTLYTNGIVCNATVNHIIIRSGIAILKYPTLIPKGSVETIVFPPKLKEIREQYKGTSDHCIECSIRDGRNLKCFPSLERLYAKFKVNEMPDSIFLPNIKVLSINSEMFKTGMHVFVGDKIDSIYNFRYAVNRHIHFVSAIPPVLEGGRYVQHIELANNSSFILHVPIGSAAAYRACFNNGGTNVTIIEETIDVTDVSLDKHEVSLNVDNTHTLSVAVSPENATNKSVMWNSDNTDVATVNNRGVVTAKKAGKAIITVSSISNPEIKDCCEITVIQPATRIQLNETAITLVQDIGTKQLVATIKPDNTTDKTVLWSSSDTEIATVDANGLVTAKKAGKCTITATAASNQEATATCEVTVIQPVTGVQLSQSDCQMTAIGESIQLEATVFPEDATNKNVTWSSSNESICTVANGKVVATGFGIAVVTVKTEDGEYTAECIVTVAQLPNMVTLDKDAITLAPTKKERLTATIMPESATDKTVLWSSSDTEIATVDANGLVTAKKAGKCTITATAASNPEVTATCEVTVTQPVTGLTLSETTLLLTQLGEMIQLTANVMPEDATDKTVIWLSSNTAVCAVSGNGTVVATGFGTAVIVATTVDGGYMASCTVVVEKVAVPISSIELSQSSASLKKGETLQLSAMVLPEDATDKTLIWRSSDESVCLVSQMGFVVAINDGTSTITASTENGAVKAQCEILVVSTATAIDGISEDGQDGGSIYNAMGVKVQNVKKGHLYIRNGRKYIVK